MRPLSILSLVLVSWPRPGATGEIEEAEFARKRDAMVRRHLAARDIRDPKVLAAMGSVPRHRFVPSERGGSAYEDRPLSIGHGQTISQPYVVAFMTQALRLKGGEKVLEIGTESGYQAAVLARIAGRVFSVEILRPLAERAAEALKAEGFTNVTVRHGDGYRGWPEEAPFDAIVVTAAPDHVPQPLIDQLAPGGRLVIPVGTELQQVLLVEKDAEGTHTRALLPVRFVPMTGEAQRPRRPN